MLSKLKELYKSVTTNDAYEDILSSVELTKDVKGNMLQVGFTSLYLVEALRESEDDKRNITILSCKDKPEKRAEDYLTLGYHLSDYHTDVHYVSMPTELYLDSVKEHGAYDSLSVVFLDEDDPTVDNRQHYFRSCSPLVRPGGLMVFHDTDKYDHASVHTLVLSKGFAEVKTNSKTVASYVRVDREGYVNSEDEESIEHDE